MACINHFYVSSYVWLLLHLYLKKIWKMDENEVVLSSPTQINKTRFHFTIEKDICLLKEVLKCNPYQLGGEKWIYVVKNLKEDCGWEISIRTAKERINNLIMKLQKEDLTSRTGTEEQASERKTLLLEIQQLKEEVVSEFCASSSNFRKEELKEANRKREEVVQSAYGADSPLSENSTRRKRTKQTTEEEILLKKQCMDYELEQKKLEYQHEEKMKQIEADQEYRCKTLEVENRRIELEKANKDMLIMILNTVNTLAKNNKNES